jgi:hypothetical protein
MLSHALALGHDDRVVELATGTLRIRVEASSWPLNELCDFAARNNPRRGFLIVSRVLGRHLPAQPSIMRRSARDLAALLPGDLPGPILVVGLAETAVCLGQTVHREWRALTGRNDIFFIHSTRQHVDHPLLCRFEEPHSHAPAHLIYRPAVRGFAEPKSLVLVDDEVSTGTTLANLAAALVDCWPGVERIAIASLTDWSGGAWAQHLPCRADAVSLLTGALEWTAHARPAAYDVGPPAAGAFGGIQDNRNRGRLGLRMPQMDLPQRLPDLPSGARLRIIGTGEFTYPPFLLAERLERAGFDVVVQSTSRSPAPLGGAIRSAMCFRDNYGSGVPSFLYNARASDGRSTWVCFETPEGSLDPALIDALGAEAVGWPA